MNELFEKELRNISINDKSLADYVIDNYVPMSVIKGIKAEIKSLMKEQETHFDVLEVGANRAFCRTLSIIDRHIREGRARQKVANNNVEKRNRWKSPSASNSKYLSSKLIITTCGKFCKRERSE